MDSEMQSRFPMLSLVTGVLKVTGWILLAVAAIGLLMSLVDATKTGHTFNVGDMAQVGMSSWGIVSALGVVAFSEVIGVVLAIEANTRQTAEHTTVAAGHAAETVRQLGKALS
jgi:hypothetical protein